jgi:two-component system response regulator FixJ
MTEKRVYLVDDEEAIRRSAGFMLRTSGHQVETYASGDEFLKAAADLAPGCVLLDIRMPGSDGLAVQQALVDRGIPLPVVIMTGHGDVGIAVRAMKAGAVDFIEKPFEKAVLLAALELGWTRLDRSGRQRVQAEEAAHRLKVLTPRERDVLDGLVDGLPNKTIAFDLGISPRTVEIHRANLMAKLEVKSLSEALRLAFAAAEVDGRS